MILCFQFVSAASATGQWLLRFTSKTFELDLRYLGQRKYGSGKMYWVTFGWPWPKFTAVTLINKKFACLQDKVRTIQPIITKLCTYIPLAMISSWLDFGGLLFETPLLLNFLRKLHICFFKVKHFIGHISGMVSLIDMKRKRRCTGWILGELCDLNVDLTHDLDLWFFKVKFFKIAVSEQLLSDWCETKWKQIS